MHKLGQNLHKNNNCTGSTYFKIKKTNLYWHKGSPLLFIINKIHIKKYMVYSSENTRAR